MKATENEIEKAMSVLEQNGYFVRNLWHVNDVLNNFEQCPKDEALDVLYDALTKDNVMEQTWNAISYEVERRGHEINA